MGKSINCSCPRPGIPNAAGTERFRETHMAKEGESEEETEFG